MERKEKERLANLRKRRFQAGYTDRNNKEREKPIDFLKDTQFRAGVQTSFKSVTREQRQRSLASKTDPPAIGKYTPKYDLV